MPEQSKQKHGGARKNAGRPKKEETIVIRIPKSKAEYIKNLIKK